MLNLDYMGRQIAAWNSTGSCADVSREPAEGACGWIHGHDEGPREPCEPGDCGIS